MDRIQELVNILNKYAHHYYVLDEPIVSDAEYDVLYDELVKLENKTGIVLENSPTLRVGGEPLKKFEQSKHLKRLYSLDKCQSAEQFSDWIGRLKKTLGYFPTITAEYKFDGLTLNLLYEDGKLVKALTRGNGETGEIVTEQVKTIKSVPLTIDFKGRVEMQGEGIMRLSALERYNKNASEPLKNARNGAAGAIRNLNPKVTAKRSLDFMCYNVGFSEKAFQTQFAMREFITEQGFKAGGDFAVIKTEEEAMLFASNTQEKREALDYLIDGVVFKVNEQKERQKLGFTEKFPRWAIAYKFKPDEMTTRLNDVVWEVSRTLRINPLAHLEPVDIAGTTVSRATLNNFSDIQKKKVKIGSRVFIRRSNDVIPEITGVAEQPNDAIDILEPTECPACHSSVKKRGAFLYCTNTHGECTPQIVAKFKHFASKGAMDIDGFSEKTAELLYNNIGLRTFPQLYAIKSEDLQGLEGFGDKKILNLTQAIEASKNTTLERFLFAIGIAGIGKKTAKDIAKKLSTLENVMTATQDELSNVLGIGDVLAQNIVNFFNNLENLEIISGLEKAGVSFEQTQVKMGVFSGLNVVLTGSLSSYKRSEAQKLIVENGGEISDNVSKSVNLVIVGEDAGSKLEKANKLGIKVISEAQFLALLK